jgi:pimeloyl-ACP methyl ester carboxylesterase
MTKLQRAQSVHIPVPWGPIEGMLQLPANARGLVLFAHGSGSSRHSPRNDCVAAALRAAGVGTLLMDLLTPQEEAVAEMRFDIALLTRRLLAATQWLQQSGNASGLPLGYFGASTGAAAALQAAARLGTAIAAVVSRGGRPDMAGGPALDNVLAPPLLLVGRQDAELIGLNREACAQLRCEKELAIVAGATHLFEEPGTLEEVALQATNWFVRHLKQSASALHAEA